MSLSYERLGEIKADPLTVKSQEIMALVSEVYRLRDRVRAAEVEAGWVCPAPELHTALEWCRAQLVSFRYDPSEQRPFWIPDSINNGWVGVGSSLTDAIKDYLKRRPRPPAGEFYR